MRNWAMAQVLAAVVVVFLVIGLAGTACGEAEEPPGDIGETTTTRALDDGGEAEEGVPGEPASEEPSPATTASEQTQPPTGPPEAITVVEGLRIPWDMAFLPDDRLLITEREGRVAVADVETGDVQEVGQVDVRAIGEGGLMGLALDPDFPAEPYIYVSFTHDRGGELANRVSRFELTGAEEGGSLSLGEETVLLDGIPAGRTHNGSRVAFGPDGYLWMTTGDAGEEGLAQEMGSLAGKVLRMTKDGQAPSDNPFADEPHPFSLIYTLGHRNPQGLDFHPGSGQAFVTEHGPVGYDEINPLRAGGNYGWPQFQGAVNEPGYEDPIMTYTPAVAPAGGLFYTGDRLGALEGAFLFVTLRGSALRALLPADEDLREVAEERVFFDDEFGRLRAIAQGPDGAVYIATSNHDGRGNLREGDDRILRVEAGP